MESTRVQEGQAIPNLLDWHPRTLGRVAGLGESLLSPGKGC